MLLAAVLLLSSSGCKKVSNQAIFDDMSKAMAEVHSYRMVMDISICMEAYGMKMTIKASLDGQVIDNPTKMKGTMNVKIPFSEDQTMEMYSEVQGDQVAVYAQDLQTGQWIKTLTPNTQNSGSSLAYSGFGDIFKNAKRNEQTLNGKAAYRFVAEITGEQMNELFNSLGNQVNKEMLEMFDDLDFSGSKTPIVLYIDKDSAQVLGMDFELSDLLQKAMASQGVEMDDMTISFIMRFSDYNAIADFEIPPEALEAPEAGSDSDPLFPSTNILT